MHPCVTTLKLNTDGRCGLPTYDYSQSGAYFVTICTHRRECLFENDEFRATAEAVWQATTSSDAGTTDDFVVMPNHLHGIVWIMERDVVGARQRLQPIGPGHHANDPQCSRDMSSLLRPNGPSSGSLGAIIGSFKTATAKRINNIRQTPGAAVGSVTTTSTSSGTRTVFGAFESIFSTTRAGGPTTQRTL